MSQSQELQNSKIDQTTTKQGNLKGRNFTGSGVAVNPTDLVPLSQVKDLIKQYGGKLFPTSATAQTQQGIPNNDPTTTTGFIPAVGTPNGILFYDAVGQATTDEGNFSYQGNGLLSIVNLIISALAQYGVLLGGGNGDIGVATIGTAGRVLTDNGAGADPSFQAIPAGYAGFSSQTAYTSVTRSLNTVQHNTGTKPIFVKCWATITLGGTIQGLSDAANPPVTVVDDATIPAVALYAVSVSFVVLPGNFYEVTLVGGTWGGWIEWV